MSLLTIIQQAAAICNLPRPTSAFSSSDNNIQQLVTFSQLAGEDMLKRANWRLLRIPGVCIGDGASTVFQCPAEFKRIAPSTRAPVGALISCVWPYSPLIGPVRDEVLNQMKAIGVTVQPSVWRLTCGCIEFFPALALMEKVNFEFYSKFWIQSMADGEPLRVQYWTSDNDTALVGEDLVRTYAVWRFKRAKGLDYAEEFADYERSLNLDTAQEGIDRTVSMSTSFVGNSDTFYGGQITYIGP